MKKLVNKIKDTLSILSSSKGFTLLELLVVVLIIGILAGIALPQYRKAVAKSKVTQAITAIASLKEATELWCLENNISGKYSFLGDAFDYGNIKSAFLNIDFPCEESSIGYCHNNNWRFQVFCTSDFCHVAASTETGSYQVLVAERDNATGEWSYTCGYFDDIGQTICQDLVSQGWIPSENFDY